MTALDPKPRTAPSAYWLEGFARHAGDGGDAAGMEQTRAWYRSLLAPHVPANAGVLLDVGCGRGSVIRALAALAPGARCVGIDGNEATLAAARRELADARVDAELHCLDLTGPDFERALAQRHGTFDLITSMFVMHHYPPAMAGGILRRLRALLAPAGVIVLAECHDPAAADAALSEQVCARLSLLAGDVPDVLWSEAELREACRLGGFEDGDMRLVAAPGWPFTSAEAAANRRTLDRLWSSVQAAEEQLLSPAAAAQIAPLKRLVTTMCEHGIARPARFGPLLAILR
jgi:SAM-dependent methyltransferase